MGNRMKPEYIHDPCLACGVRCMSQLEFMDINNDRPWPYCSGCDPKLRADEEKDEYIDVNSVEIQNGKP